MVPYVGCVTRCDPLRGKVPDLVPASMPPGAASISERTTACVLVFSVQNSSACFRSDRYCTIVESKLTNGNRRGGVAAHVIASEHLTALPARWTVWGSLGRLRGREGDRPAPAVAAVTFGARYHFTTNKQGVGVRASVSLFDCYQIDYPPILAYQFQQLVWGHT